MLCSIRSNDAFSFKIENKVKFKWKFALIRISQILKLIQRKSETNLISSLSIIIVNP